MLNVADKLREKGLKVTPQRIAIYSAVASLENHPTAEHIVEAIKQEHPSISVGTVYKVLHVLVDQGLVCKVKSTQDSMRYDAMIDHHHHLYCADTDRIEDYRDDELDGILAEYFKRKKIKDFKIEEFKLQLTGKFTK